MFGLVSTSIYFKCVSRSKDSSVKPSSSFLLSDDNWDNTSSFPLLVSQGFVCVSLSPLPFVGRRVGLTTPAVDGGESVWVGPRGLRHGRHDGGRVGGRSYRFVFLSPYSILPGVLQGQGYEWRGDKLTCFIHLFVVRYQMFHERVG